MLIHNSRLGRHGIGPSNRQNSGGVRSRAFSQGVNAGRESETPVDEGEMCISAPSVRGEVEPKKKHEWLSCRGLQKRK